MDISDCVGAAPYKTLCSTLSVSWATMYLTKSESVDEFSYSSSIISHEMGHSVGFEHRDNCPCGEKPPAHCRMFSTYKKYKFEIRCVCKQITYFFYVTEEGP